MKHLERTHQSAYSPHYEAIDHIITQLSILSDLPPINRIMMKRNRVKRSVQHRIEVENDQIANKDFCTPEKRFH